MRIDLTLNGKAASVEAEATATLLEVLRGDLGLMGARYGCGNHAGDPHRRDQDEVEADVDRRPGEQAAQVEGL